MNRSRRGGRQATPSRPKPKSGFFLPDLGKKSIYANIVNEVKSLIEEAFNKPLQGIVGAGSLITTGLSVLGFSQDKNEPYGSHFSTGLLSVFPARVIAFMIIAGSIAWTISLVGIWLTSVNNEVRKLFAHLVTAFGALFMAACIEWIFQPDISKSPVIVLLFSIIGVAFGIFLAKTNFRLTLEPDPEVIAVRAGLLMNFAMVATALVILVQLTGLS
ncbi:hypothetical protein [Hoeflea sp.]|uniref:hypothetical protein n=1 Tax=Hoeflea sp. TaxID=1940281 RepID=UPI003A92334B